MELRIKIKGKLRKEEEEIMVSRDYNKVLTFSLLHYCFKRVR